MGLLAIYRFVMSARAMCLLVTISNSQTPSSGVTFSPSLSTEHFFKIGVHLKKAKKSLWKNRIERDYYYLLFVLQFRDQVKFYFLFLQDGDVNFLRDSLYSVLQRRCRPQLSRLL
jgi:hypothetical protein